MKILWSLFDFLNEGVLRSTNIQRYMKGIETART